jgi:predicted metal-dependent phosphoesterase TrpH
MNVDLHCHSKASWDCVSDFAPLIARCKHKGIRYQAITDHNEIWGAQELERMTRHDPDITIIVGEEVYSDAGEIIGLYLEECIPAGLSALETAKRIKAQGGLVLLPHPFDKFKRSHLKTKAREEIMPLVDIVEVFNAHVSRQRFNRAAKTWAHLHHKAMSAGSDAHTLEHIGSAYTEVIERVITGPAELLASLHTGKIIGRWRHPASTLLSRAIYYSQQKFASPKGKK